MKEFRDFDFIDAIKEDAVNTPPITLTAPLYFQLNQ